MRDRMLVIIGTVLVVLNLLVPGGYQLCTSIREGRPHTETGDMKRRDTVNGYEEPEEVVEYVLYQIHQGDLDLALRGCAVQEVSQNFSIQSYGEIMNEFPWTRTLAPADYENQGYIEINQARMAAVYSNMLEQCMGIFGDGYDLEVLCIQRNIPEDADGYYYQDIRNICGIVGARDACNVDIFMRVDGVPRKMTVTTARYKKYWKILQFSEYQNYQYVEPQISEYAENMDISELPLEWDSLENAVLPCNYDLAGNKSSEDLEEFAREIFIYLQRGDVWKILSRYDLYDSEEDLYPDSVFLDRQSRAAVQLQEFYYRILLYDGDKMSWIYQNVKDEAVNLLSLMNMTDMLYANLYRVEVTENGDGTAVCRLEYGYDKGWFATNICLVYKDGWKIVSILPA